MPWASEAQRRKFYATPSLHKFIPDFNAATPKGTRLPERVGDKRSEIHKAALAHMRRRHGTG